MIPTFHSAEPLAAGATVTLGTDVANHVRARRLMTGDRVRLADGAGLAGEGTLERIGRATVTVALRAVSPQAAPPAVHLLAPIGDRDRMLWLVEKATELGVASWRPVLYRRSRSVSPKGEGPGFQNRARARAVAAMEQSGGAWLPTFYPDAPVERAIAAAPPGVRLLLDPGGTPLATATLTEPVTIALGPEGGLEEDEQRALIEAGFAPVSLGGNVLRFETAAVAGLAVVASMLAAATVRA